MFDGFINAEQGHRDTVSQSLNALLSTLRETHRRRVDLMRASTKLTLQIKAIARRMCGGDKDEANKRLLPAALDGKGDHPEKARFLEWCEPLLQARMVIEGHRKIEEKAIEKLAKQLPIAGWISSVKGLGWLSVGGLVAEIGDPGMYANPAKIWKRMGLAVIGGGRQRKIAGDAALEHGYSPERRSLMWNIGSGLIKCQSEWRDLYLARMATEHAKAIDEGLVPATTGKATVDSWEARGLPPLTKVTKLTDECRGAGHMHNRSQRYMEKRLLREFWKAWRDATGPVA
jgi:hypothetical protein